MKTASFSSRWFLFWRPGCRWLLAALALGVAPALWAIEGRLLPEDVVVSREKGRETAVMAFSLLVRGGAADGGTFAAPEKLRLRVTSGEIVSEADFFLQPQAAETGLAGNGHAEYRFQGVLPTSARGPTLLEVADAGPFFGLRTLVSVLPARDESKANQTPAERPPELLPEPVARKATLKRIVPEIQPNEPVYFTLGGFRGGIHRLDARFQLSLKYRFTAENETIGNLGAAITTTSLWDLHSYSVPFRDTTYRPAILWMFPTKKSAAHPQLSWSADFGIFEHESNGRGPDPDQPFSSANNDNLSRSMNRSYLRPTLTWTDPEWGAFSVTPKIFVPYLVSDGNKDIAEYRGYFDLLLKWTSQPDRGHVVSLLFRDGTHHGHHFVEADYGLPLRVFSKDANGWFLFQWLYGYGETLRDYRVRNPGTLRAGLMIVP